jgi:dephospho-CoA kinase
VAEVPLLFEAGFEVDFDMTVAVVAPEERRQGWAVERGTDEAALAAIESRQLSGEEKGRRVDLVVANDGTPAKLREDAKDLKKRALSEADL